MKSVMILAVFAATLGFTVPQTVRASQSQAQEKVVVAQEVKYQEIKSEELPEVIGKALAKDYPDYVVDKAYKGSDGGYKLDVSKGDVKYVLYYDEAGKFIKVEYPEASKL